MHTNSENRPVKRDIKSQVNNENSGLMTGWLFLGFTSLHKMDGLLTGYRGSRKMFFFSTQFFKIFKKY